MKSSSQKNTNLTVSANFSGQKPPVTRVKTDGRIGSATPHSMLKGGFTVDNNRKAQPHAGSLGSKTASHVSVDHDGGSVFSPRAKAARNMAKPNPKAYANPVNVDRPSLKKVRPS